MTTAFGPTLIDLGSPAVGSTLDGPDLFAVQLTEGVSYQIEAVGIGGPQVRPDYLIYEAASAPEFGIFIRGNPVPFTIGSEFTAPDSVVYIIEVFERDPSERGRYSLEVDSYDYADGPETTGQVRVEGSARGVIEDAGDSDWFRLQLVGGQTYQIDLLKEGLGLEGLRDPLIGNIYDAQGRIILDTSALPDVDDGGDELNSRLFFTPPASGEYFIVAGGYSMNTGSYALQVQQLDQFSSDIGTTGIVPASGMARGSIQPAGDVDWFLVSLQAGEAYTIRMSGVGDGERALGNPSLNGLYDSSGLQYLSSLQTTEEPAWTH